MLRYFPRPFPDETLYSLVARFQSHCLCLGFLPSLKELFGDYHCDLKIDLPTNISKFSEETYHLLQKTDEEVINEMTLWPYYSHFVNSENHSLRLSALKGRSTREFDLKSGLKGSNIKRSILPLFCPKCIVEDYNNFGEMYWKRAHQIPSILICSKHNCFLEKATIGSKYSAIKMKVILASHETCKPTKIRQNTNSIIHQFSEKMAALLYNDREVDQVFDTFYYKDLAYQYYSKGSFIDISKLLDDMNQFFGDSTLTEYQNSLVWTKGKLYTKDSLRKKYLINPLTHLMFSTFFNNLLKIEKTEKAEESIDKMKCINRWAKHEDGLIILAKRVGYSTKRRQYYSLFSCSCGMRWRAYSGLKNKEPEIVIVDYGLRWKSIFYEKINSGESLENISRQSNVSLDNLLKKAKRRSGFKKEIIERYEREKKTIIKCKQYRLNWEIALKNYSNLTITEIAKIQWREYNWLSRNDKEWMKMKHSSRSPIRYTRSSKYDYTKLDDELFEKIDLVHKKLLYNKYRYRITKTTLRKAAGISVGLKTISKLTKTSRLILNIVESDHDRSNRLDIRQKTNLITNCLSEL